MLLTAIDEFELYVTKDGFFVECGLKAARWRVRVTVEDGDAMLCRTGVWARCPE
jgi:hypothetical protein